MVKRKLSKTKNCGNKVKKKKNANAKKANAARKPRVSASKSTKFFRKSVLSEAQVFSEEELDFMLSLESNFKAKDAIDCTVLLKVATKMMALPNLENYVSEIAGLLHWSIVGDAEERTAQVVLSGCSKLTVSSLLNIGKLFSLRKNVCRMLILVVLKEVSVNYRWVVALLSNDCTSNIVRPNVTAWYSAAEDTVKESFRRLVLPYLCNFPAPRKRAPAIHQLVETWIIKFRSDRNDIFAYVKRNPEENCGIVLHWHNWFATGVVTRELLKRVKLHLRFLCVKDFKLLLEICYCTNDVELLEEFVLAPFRSSLFRLIKFLGSTALLCFILQPTTWDDYYFPNLHNQEIRHAILILFRNNLTHCILPFVEKHVTAMLSKEWKVPLVSRILKNSTGDGAAVEAAMLAVTRDIMQNHLPLLPTSSMYHLLAENIDADAFLYAVNAEDKNHVYFSVCLLAALKGQGLKAFLTNDSSFEILGQLLHTEIPGVLEILESRRPLLEEILHQANTSHKEYFLYLLHDKYGERWNHLV